MITDNELAVGVGSFKTIQAILGKLTLIFVGFIFLFNVSGSALAPILLGVVAMIGWAIAAGLSRLQSMPFRRLVGRLVVPFGFFTIVLLNVTGFIGTLTGTYGSNSFGTLSLVAAPFYMLSTAAVVADVATKRMALPKLIDYFTYVTLPFKLLAGPLEPPTFIRQIRDWKPRFSWVRISGAWPWMALGMTMKFVIANRLVPGNTLSDTHPVVALMTAAIFELDFYFDFAGYSFIGYGMAIAFGFRINQNFASPFFMQNVVLFWRHWHMSLGRFLARYLLEPNVGKIKKRPARMLFTSSIFLVSAMWHGGTANYLLWGIFHGSCYLLYIGKLKHIEIRRPLGILAMLAFFVMGRLIAIDANWPRLLEKLMNLVNPFAWIDDFENLSTRLHGIYQTQFAMLVAAAVFLSVEGLSIRLYGSHAGRTYHLFRRPLSAFFLLIICAVFAIGKGGLLYARL